MAEVTRNPAAIGKATQEVLDERGVGPIQIGGPTIEKVRIPPKEIAKAPALKMLLIYLAFVGSRDATKTSNTSILTDHQCASSEETDRQVMQWNINPANTRFSADEIRLLAKIADEDRPASWVVEHLLQWYSRE